MADVAALSCRGIALGALVDMFGGSQVWLPISIPASAIRLAAAGSPATLLPIKKNVAFAPSAFSTYRRRSVNGLGPSSNVSATHLAWRQSPLSALTGRRVWI